jgi:hypothetical protein
MARLRITIATALAAAMIILPSLATAGLFEDEQARKAVLELLCCAAK